MNTLKPKRIIAHHACGVLIDVQEYFLKQLDAKERDRIEINLQGLTLLLSYLKIPVLATHERPLEIKGELPAALKDLLDGFEHGEIFAKDFFDFTRHREITSYLRSLKRRQILLAGCEFDVCVLQSGLGLLDLGYEVFVVEDLIFSSSPNVNAAVDRLKAAGAVFISLKTLYYELTEAVASSPQRQKLVEKFGPFPEGLL